MTRRLLAFLVFVLLSAGFAGGVGWFALTSGQEQMAERARADLALASDRLTSQLQQYRELAVLMADHPQMVLTLEEGTGVDRAAGVLLRAADKTGTLNLRLVGASGRILASSQPQETGQDRAGTEAFSRAMQGSLGRQNGLGAQGERRYTVAAPVFGRGGAVLGVVEADVDIWDVEEVWLGDPQAVFFTDAAGVVFVSNRTELLLRSRVDTPAAVARRAAQGYAADRLGAFPAVTIKRRAGQQIWHVDGGPYLPGRALYLAQELPVIGMTGELLMSVVPAERMALLQAAVAFALSLTVGAALLLLIERRRALSARLHIEEMAKAQLETRVAQRTRELSEANRALRWEVAERHEAETALKRAQAELVQAGKLSALGKMSAGLSHELNQPLMAIRSFAENGALLLERDKPEQAAQNLGRISDLARRMGRIIKNLRAFARQESEPVTTVDLSGVVDAVLEMADARLTQADVTLRYQRPAGPVMVRGGEVRLQQVLLNLVTNAADAMEGSAPRVLTIRLMPGHATTVLSVRDTGPGIAEPEKIFDPFYSTKEVGASEGMGLGLSISYGLVQSFGGAIRGRNPAGGGAEFTVELATAAQGGEESA